uniref:Uncharacterized protein n=1 Tax=Arundo donax TaxID=35708 RepID=A0A0A9EAY8_ARUDO
MHELRQAKPASEYQIGTIFNRTSRISVKQILFVYKINLLDVRLDKKTLMSLLTVAT